MAKLKIFEGNNTDPNTPPSKDGYIAVTNGLLNDLVNFRRASEKKRSDLLQGYAGKQHTIYQQTRNPPPDDNEAICSENCKVIIKDDERKKTGVNFGTHHMVLPEIQAGDDALNANYLAKHVKAISELYADGSPANVKKATQFLFGLMLLTRCR